MKNKKWISLAAAVVLAVTALPMGVFAAKKDGEEEKLTKVTLNEVAHSIFYAPQYVAIEEGYFAKERKFSAVARAACRKWSLNTFSVKTDWIRRKT